MILKQLARISVIYNNNFVWICEGNFWNCFVYLDTFVTTVIGHSFSEHFSILFRFVNFFWYYVLFITLTLKASSNFYIYCIMCAKFRSVLYDWVLTVCAFVRCKLRCCCKIHCYGKGDKKDVVSEEINKSRKYIFVSRINFLIALCIVWWYYLI